MSDFGDGTWLKARKQHRCEWCYGLILKGETHYQYKGMYGGEWQNWRMHPECHADWDTPGEDNEFMPGDHERPSRVAV